MIPARRGWFAEYQAVDKSGQTLEPLVGWDDEGTPLICLPDGTLTDAREYVHETVGAGDWPFTRIINDAVFAETYAVAGGGWRLKIRDEAFAVIAFRITWGEEPHVRAIYYQGDYPRSVRLSPNLVGRLLPPEGKPR